MPEPPLRPGYLVDSAKRDKKLPPKYSMRIRELLWEIERGGYVEPDVLQDLQSDKFQNPQRDLFPEIPRLEPGGHPDYTQVGRIGGFFVLHKQGQEDHLYILMDRSRVIGWISLIPIGSEYQDYPHRNRDLKYHLTGTGFQVAGVYIDPEYSGRGLAVQMYEWLLRNVCDYIARDSSHTPGGEALWKKLLNSRRFDVMVYDPNKGTSRRRWAGKDWGHVYQDFYLSPWVTLAGKAQDLIER
jgi:GNAT superfamily N-acetyltransferase